MMPLLDTYDPTVAQVLSHHVFSFNVPRECCAVIVVAVEVLANASDFAFRLVSVEKMYANN